MSTIILTGGGTAGHCTPSMALVPYLKRDFDKIIYIGSKNGIEKSIVEKTDIPYYSVETVKLKRSFSLSNLTIPFKLINGTREAGKILDKIKPDVIFSKGGYVALPVIFAARKRKIPVIAHESDYTLGLANRLSAKRCKKILTAFFDTAIKIKNGVYVGTPLRRELFEINKKTALSFYGLDGNKPVLLVTGGSSGAKTINDTVRDALPLLLKRFDVLHVCGKGNLSGTINMKGYVQIEFTDMSKAYAACDIAVSRAGSNTLFELLALNIPSLLIPLPKVNSRGDQVVNAEYFLKKGLVSVLDQNSLTKESLLSGVNSLYLNRATFKHNLHNYGVKDASYEISLILRECAKEKQP